LYWKLLGPVHHLAFDRMARHRIRRASRRTGYDQSLSAAVILEHPEEEGE
jgi:hypothetical protein